MSCLFTKKTKIQTLRILVLEFYGSKILESNIEEINVSDGDSYVIFGHFKKEKKHFPFMFIPTKNCVVAMFSSQIVSV